MDVFNVVHFWKNQVEKKVIPVPLFIVFHLVQAFGTAKSLVDFITKKSNCVSFSFMKFFAPVNFDKAIRLLYFN